ncbi:hypothetical protein BH23CHL2_BH23CHL2_03060 [soil metagenome]
MAEGETELVEQLNDMSARQLVRWLATPVLSGFYLSPDDLRRLGAHIGVNVAPYGRANGLEQLLRGASLDDRLGDALALLRAEMADHLERYKALELPALGPWIERAEATLDAWTAIAEGFQDEGAVRKQP